MPAETSPDERLLEAAIVVFGERGFQKTTLQEIVEHAGVSKPLFYRRYENKAAIFEAAIERVFDDWRGALEAAARAAADDPAAALRATFLGQLAYARSRPFLNRLLTRDAQLILTDRAEIWDRAVDALRRLVTTQVERGRQRGDLRRDLPATHMTDLLTEVHLSYANRQLLTGAPVPPRLAESVITSVLDGLAAR